MQLDKVKKGQRTKYFIIGLLAIIDGLVLIFSLGRYMTNLQLDYVFSSRFDEANMK